MPHHLPAPLRNPLRVALVGVLALILGFTGVPAAQAADYSWTVQKLSVAGSSTGISGSRVVGYSDNGGWYYDLANPSAGVRVLPGPSAIAQSHAAAVDGRWAVGSTDTNELGSEPAAWDLSSPSLTHVRLAGPAGSRAWPKTVSGNRAAGYTNDEATVWDLTSGRATSLHTAVGARAGDSSEITDMEGSVVVGTIWRASGLGTFAYDLDARRLLFQDDSLDVYFATMMISNGWILRQISDDPAPGRPDLLRNLATGATIDPATFLPPGKEAYETAMAGGKVIVRIAEDDATFTYDPASGVRDNWNLATAGDYRYVTDADGYVAVGRYHNQAAIWTRQPLGGSAYQDVAPGNQFYNEMAWLYQQGISTGWTVLGGREYRPLQPVNRDAMAAFMYRLAGSPAFTPPARSPFLDVTPQTQFYKEITWLANKGITTGWDVPRGKEYRPLQPVNRDAMAAFMYRLKTANLIR